MPFRKKPPPLPPRKNPTAVGPTSFALLALVSYSYTVIANYHHRYSASALCFHFWLLYSVGVVHVVECFFFFFFQVCFDLFVTVLSGVSKLYTAKQNSLPNCPCEWIFNMSGIWDSNSP